MHPARFLASACAPACNVLDAACRALTASLGAGMAGVIALQVFFRYALNDSLFWSEELGRILLVWLTFVGACTAWRLGAHIGVDALVRALPARVRGAARAAALVVCLGFFTAMAVAGWRYMLLVWAQTTPALGWPMSLPVAAVPLSGAVLALFALCDLLDPHAAARRAGEPGP